MLGLNDSARGAAKIAKKANSSACGVSLLSAFSLPDLQDTRILMQRRACIDSLLSPKYFQLPCNATARLLQKRHVLKL